MTTRDRPFFLGSNPRKTYIAPALGAALLLGCSAPPPTAIIVDAFTDYVVPGEMARVEVVVAGPTEEQRHDFLLGASDDNGRSVMPLRFALYPDGALDAPFSITATGFNPTDVRLVQQSAALSFVPRKQHVLELFLARACAGRPCQGADATTCSHGTCVPRQRHAPNLPLFVGQRPDASRPD